MKKQLFYLIAFLLTFNTLTAQHNQSFKVYGIKIDTISTMVKKHPKYFEHLKKQWREKGQLSNDELVLLYYGSAFMSEYQPKKEDKDVEKITKLMGEMDFETAIIEGKKLLEVYPLNARLRMLLGYAHKKIGEKAAAKYYYKTYGDILRIPLYSGNGKDFDNALNVRIISDEYLILNQKDLELVQQEVRFKDKIPFDVLLVKPKSYENKRMKKLPKEKLYFNIYLPFMVGENQSFEKLQREAQKKYKIKE